ncbi:D-Ala-D-Ala carboxypeptidase family metallohydrolase [Dehalobacter sp. DCM]|uniref:D-Ala-D-Ala carboxypeptidase family metallohydrolase n=1 Tax=Dehalobacter sp. DCM TaxID=2907827 RepID=UPI00308182B8|nr:D-Ala-D-Ala carboxypeptidase family metallohydrolase [Dehalobacter sp. DCM]
MGVQDTGCLRNVPAGYGLIRELNGSCRYFPDNQFVSANFRMKEFNPSGVRPYGVMRKLVNQLQVMRNALGVPIIITSAYRSGSTHASGLAVDIVVPRKSFIQLAQAAYNAGFRRIEVVKRAGTSYSNTMSFGGHVHVDVYDGSGISTSGTIYDCPTCSSRPCYPWYAFGVSGSWWATSQPNTFSQLMANLRADRGNTGYRGC